MLGAVPLDTDTELDLSPSWRDKPVAFSAAQTFPEVIINSRLASINSHNINAKIIYKIQKQFNFLSIIDQNYLVYLKLNLLAKHFQ